MTKKKKKIRQKVILSVVLATKNEEENIGACLTSVKEIADEIIIFDEYSKDQTRKIAKRLGAQVFKYRHKKNFHETKQKAIEKAGGKWIFQLDADERVTKPLREEIKKTINATDAQREKDFNKKALQKNKKYALFVRHQRLISKRDKLTGETDGPINAYFIPRLNFFLGQPLKLAGVYPDAVIRLFKNGKAYLPAKDVHEMPIVKGKVGWLFSNLHHHESPTFDRYLKRSNRYTDLLAKDFAKQEIPLSYFAFFSFAFIRPFLEFLKLYVRHKGFLVGFSGFVWSFYSALRFPLAYFKYWQQNKK